MKQEWGAIAQSKMRFSPVKGGPLFFAARLHHTWIRPTGRNKKMAANGNRLTTFSGVSKIRFVHPVELREEALRQFGSHLKLIALKLGSFSGPSCIGWSAHSAIIIIIIMKLVSSVVQRQLLRYGTNACSLAQRSILKFS